MLILSRKEGESIQIGDTISVSIIEISKGVVKLGFDAPEDTIILRSELEKAVKKSNVDANKHIPDEFLQSLRQRFK